MERTTASGNVSNRFVDGDPSLGIMGTVVDADWLNSVQEELANAIEGMGGVLDPLNEHQLKDALLAKFAASHWKDPVATSAELPGSGNSLGDCRQVTSDPNPDNDVVWTWDGSAWSNNLPPRIPAGMVISHAASTVPTGWLECNGAEVSRTTYAALFAAIDTAFGVGNGSTTFNLPDFRGEFLRGWDHGRGADPDAATRTGGDTVGSTQTDQLKSHNHGFKYSSTGGSGGAVTWLKDTGPNTDTTAILAAGGSETRPRNVAVMFCIKY